MRDMENGDVKMHKTDAKISLSFVEKNRKKLLTN